MLTSKIKNSLLPKIRSAIAQSISTSVRSSQNYISPSFSTIITPSGLHESLTAAPLSAMFSTDDRLDFSKQFETEIKEFVFPVIDEIIASNDRVLFMKGTPQEPKCGFSKLAVLLLDHHNIPFHHVDVIADPAMRLAIKMYSDWPTIPQLFVKGELLGGTDIIQSLHETGDLKSECKI
eukprot:gnl/Dysnectes_brevis/723_a796_7108.p1 GENE.gnl/Dysnectes_brevis/723_a796_7108~~gnl/Dysnectes_brevis/723_a796_7108.p1  ORF type:complete len:178 (+),score=17.41 gnl/Dysnectes_brevis/723_a796_7108:37-570(+)